MTKEEAIKRWKIIINTVYRAEDAIHDEWRHILAETKFSSKEEKESIADKYLTAVAEEIVSKTPEEELAKLED